MAEAAERVLLLSLPFGALERPALSLGLLKAHCAREGVPCDVRYLTFPFADLIGLEEYQWVTSDELPYTAFAGDWVFARALYGPRPDSDATYVERVLRQTWQLTEADVDRLLRIRDRTEEYLQGCLDAVAWEDYTFVGFTSVFQQNIASLALAQRVSRAHPHLTIACGGANWEDVMGVALQRQFPFVDLVFSGEADESFPAVLRARRAGSPVRGIAGVHAVDDPDGSTAAGRVSDLDTVPVPVFDDYFAQRDDSDAAGIETTLLMETSRGCWWGERSHCTFCGLNGATMTFRSKSPDRVLAEFQHLSTQHGARLFSIVDDILDMTFFRTVLPRLAQAGLGIDAFWEIKANLTYEQVRLLREAGVTMVQPGIESLSDHVLKLMRKGTTVFRNVQLLKWCAELGVHPYWNLLYGFPGETAEDYELTAEHVRAIWHLDPATACGPIRLDRFSPYHSDPGAFGMVDLRPMEPFRHLYPFDDDVLSDIAYYFEFDYAEPRTPEQHALEVIDLVATWKAAPARGGLVLTVRPDDRLQILDTRGEHGHRPRRALLSGWKAAVYVTCDKGAPLSRLADLPALAAEGVGEAELLEFLRRCVEHRLMIRTGTSWLSVAVWGPGERAKRVVPEAPRRELTLLLD